MTNKVILESPFANTDRNKFNSNYFYLCLVARKLLKEDGDAPLFFHALYTQMLHDNSIEERMLGLNKSFEWHSHGDYKLYAMDRGISESKGMVLGAEDAIKKGMPIMFYSAMPKEHWISKRIEEINQIIDNQTRWETGLAFEKELKDIPEFMERFKQTGDLTGYTEHNEKIIEDVKNCILEFFAPLIDAIRTER